MAKNQDNFFHLDITLLLNRKYPKHNIQTSPPICVTRVSSETRAMWIMIFNLDLVDDKTGFHKDLIYKQDYK